MHVCFLVSLVNKTPSQPWFLTLLGTEDQCGNTKNGLPQTDGLIIFPEGNGAKVSYFCRMGNAGWILMISTNAHERVTICCSIFCHKNNPGGWICQSARSINSERMSQRYTAVFSVRGFYMHTHITFLFIQLHTVHIIPSPFSAYVSHVHVYRWHWSV